MAELILLLMIINVVGVKESSRVNILATIIDLATQLSIIILGFVLIFTVSKLAGNMFGGNWPPTWSQLIGGIPDYWPPITALVFGIAMASLAFTGVETVSQMAEDDQDITMSTDGGNHIGCRHQRIGNGQFVAEIGMDLRRRCQANEPDA